MLRNPHRGGKAGGLCDLIGRGLARLASQCQGRQAELGKASHHVTRRADWGYEDSPELTSFSQEGGVVYGEISRSLTLFRHPLYCVRGEGLAAYWKVDK